MPDTAARALGVEGLCYYDADFSVFKVTDGRGVVVDMHVLSSSCLCLLCPAWPPQRFPEERYTRW